MNSRFLIAFPEILSFSSNGEQQASCLSSRKQVFSCRDSENYLAQQSEARWQEKVKSGLADKRSNQSKYRAGDWICVKCNNHNYSFRAVCNSCKSQTKAENLLQGRNESKNDGVTFCSVSTTNESTNHETQQKRTTQRKVARLNPNNYFKPASIDGLESFGKAAQGRSENGRLWSLSMFQRTPTDASKMPDLAFGNVTNVYGLQTAEREREVESDASFDFDQATLELHLVESEDSNL